MKTKLLEKITRIFAPPTRFAALLFALCATGTTWAVYEPSDSVEWSNSGTSNATESKNICNFAFCIPASADLPAGSKVKIKSVTFASVNSSYVLYNSSTKNSDASHIVLNGVKSDALNGVTYTKTGNNYSCTPDPFSGGDKISSSASQEDYALKYNFSSECVVVVGRTYVTPNGNDTAVGKGITLLHPNGNGCGGTSSGVFVSHASVRFVNTGDSSSVISSPSATSGYYPVYDIEAEVISIADSMTPSFEYDASAGNLTMRDYSGKWSDSFSNNSTSSLNLYRVGPGGSGFVHDMGSDNTPYSSMAAKDAAFSFAVYADVAQMPNTAGRKYVLVSFGPSSGNKAILYREGDNLKLGFVNSSGTVLGTPASAAVPLSGFHLITAICDPTDGSLALYVDTTAGTAGSHEAISLGIGFQLSSIHGNLTSGFWKGTGFALSKMLGYDRKLTVEEVAALSLSYPATDGTQITGDINPAFGGTLTIYTSSATGSQYLGGSWGTVTIPANNTVSVPHVRFLNNGYSTDSVTVNINGRLEVTSTSTGYNVAWGTDGTNGDYLSYKGILLGNAGGTGTYNIGSSGFVNAPNAWLQTVYRAAGDQAVNINGGTLKVKGLFADSANSSVTLKDGGTLEVNEIISNGQAITKNFKSGTFRITADATETRAINFSAEDGYYTTLDPYGHTLTLYAAALTGSGNIRVCSSVDGEGEKGTVVFNEITTSYTGNITIVGSSKATLKAGSYTGTITVEDGATLEIDPGAGNTYACAASFAGAGDVIVKSGTVSFSGSNTLTKGIQVGDGAVVTSTTGSEGKVSVLNGGTLKLTVASNNEIWYDGYVAIDVTTTGTGAVEYYDVGGTKIVDGEYPDPNTSEATTGHFNGTNLLPYYYVWEVDAGGTAGIADGSAGWARMSGNVRPVDGKNVAFHIKGTAGQETTITVDDDATFGTVMVYGTGTAKFVSSSSHSISATMIVADSPVCIGAGAVAVSGSIRDNSAVAFTGTQTIGVAISGTGSVTVGDATTATDITFNLCNSFAGGLTVKANAVAKTTDGARSVGVGTGFGPFGGTVTVYTGGQVDVANTAGVCYDYVIEDGGVSETPALTNTGSVIGITERQARSLTVNADAIIKCDSGKGWGLVNDGYDTATLTIKKGMTLTKKGTGNFILCNTVISNTGSAETLPKLVIAEGNVSTENTGSGGAGIWDIDIENGGKLLLEKGIGACNITVKNGGMITMSGSDGWLNGLTALAIDVGGEVDCSGTTRTDSLINATTLTVNGTLKMGTHIGQISATTIAGTGTIVYAGVDSKNPAADTIFSTQNSWTGTVKLSDVTGNNRIRPEYGHANSHLQLAGAEGYFLASAAPGTEFTVPVEFVNGASGYAWKMNGGWTDTSSARSITLLDTISGTGKIWHPSTSTTGHCYVFKDATGYSGSILIENAEGAIVEFGSSAPTQGVRSYGSINVASTGSAVIGGGKSWQATNGIEIEGQVALAGAATMASSVTLNNGATLVFEDGASLAFTAASSPVTLPESGVVNIDASAMDLTSSSATILTSTADFTNADVAKLQSVGRHVFAVDGTDAKKINVYPAVAKVGDTYYADLATAEAAFAADSSVQHFEVYSGTVTGTYHSLGTVGSVTTYRKQNQNVYYKGGYWSADTVDLFELADGTVTAAYAGDTMVIDDKSSASEIWVNPTNAIAATAISVERDVTFKQGGGDGNLFDGKTLTIADGFSLTISGASRAVTLGSATFNKASSSGAVTFDGSTNGITLNGNISGTAPITIAGTVIASGRTIANTLKGSGTIVYDTTLPSSAPTFDSSWTGTVWLKNYTSLTGSSKQGSETKGTTNFDPNNYGNSNSTVKFTGVKGYLTANYDGSYEITPALELEDNGETPGLLLYNGWGYNKENNAACYTIIRELKGSGTLKADPTADGSGGSIKGLNVLLQVRNWNNFSGTLNIPNKNVVFGSTLPEQSVAEGGGKIFVRSGASVTIPSAKTWTCLTNFVDGVLSTTDNARWSGIVHVSQNGVLNLTNSSNKDDGSANYSSVVGTGTILYTGAANTYRIWPSSASNMFADTLSVSNELSGGIIINCGTSNAENPGITAFRNLSGSGNFRADNNYTVPQRRIVITQTENTEWGGYIRNDGSAANRIKSIYVLGGEGAVNKTLTLSGTQTASNELNVNPTGVVKLTGKWLGPVIVQKDGTFGGNGTVSNVTFNAGSTYRYDGGYLTATGGVTVTAGNIVFVEFADGITPVAGMVLMDWTAPDGVTENTAPAGTFRFANETYRSSWVPKVSDNQLVVAAHTSETINVASGSQDFADSYFDCTVTKTGAGVARLTGALDNVTLNIQAGTLDLACSSASGLTITGAGTLKLAMNIDLTSATFDDEFTGTIDIAYGVRVTVTSEILAKIDTTNYNVAANKDGTYTVSVKPRDSVIDFAANDPGITLSVPENGVGGTVYHMKYGKVTGVEIGTTPIEVQNLGLNDRLAPFTVALDVTMPETMPTGYADADAPILISWVIGTRERYNLFLKSDGTLQTSWVGATVTENGSARNSNNSLDASNTTALEAGKTYHIELRYWGVEASVDTGNPQVARSYSSANTGTSVWLDGVKIIADSGLRCGSLRDETDAEHTNFASSLVIGASAYDKTSSLFDGLTVNAIGFLNERAFMGNNLVVVNKVGLSALSSMASSDATAEYLYGYGVMANGVTGGYAMPEQTTVYNSPIGGNSATNTWETQGVVMTHSCGGADKFTLTMGVSIPEGGSGTVCEIPMSDSTSLTVTYSGGKFSLNGTAQDEAAGAGAHVLVLTYDTDYGAYLWVDTYDENGAVGEASNYTLANVAFKGKTLGDKIYFGSGAATTSGNGFFAGLGVIYQNVQFGMAVCTEDDVEQALEAFDFAPELAVLPLSERLKCLPLVSQSVNGGSVPLPEISVNGQVLAGFAAQAAMRNLGVYTNSAVNLSFTGYNQSSGVMTCNVSPEFFTKGSVSLVGSKNDGRTWDRLQVATPTDSGTVNFNLGAHAFDNDDYTRFKVMQELTNGVALTTGTMHDLLANTPKADGLFKYGDDGTRPQCYRIPAIASTYVPGVTAVGITSPEEAAIMALFDARYSYNDLGVPMNSSGAGLTNHAGVDHYTGIDQAGVFSLDGGATWSYPQIMVNVPNASDPKTNAKTTSLTKDMELGDPCIAYDYVNQKFIMMGITGGGIFKPYDDGADLVMYECSLDSVLRAAPSWTKVGSVLTSIQAALTTAATADNNKSVPFTPVRGADNANVYGAGYCGILQCPGHAFVARTADATKGISVGTVIWPMQYIHTQNSERLFAAWQDSEGNWHATSTVTDATYKPEEGSIVELDNGSWLYMGKDTVNANTSIVRPFYHSADHATWTSVETVLPQSVRVQGSMIRLGTHTDTHSRYAAVFCTGDDTSRETFVRKNLRVFIGTDNGNGTVSWDSANPITIWDGDTGYTNGGDVSFGYNSLVMLNPTTLGVLFEANGHIYFTKVDVADALQ